ncbi:MAG: DUF1622 domain-containing protein [Nitrospirae bacterium]|nr:DUF1622 domain-containing protein [Nitrospirota bacterium]
MVSVTTKTGILSVIVAIRTILSYFLRIELRKRIRKKRAGQFVELTGCV